MFNKKIIFYILAAFIIGNVLIIFIQFSTSKNIASLVDGNEKVLNELKVNNDLGELAKDIAYVDSKVYNPENKIKGIDAADLEAKIKEVEDDLGSLQRLSDDDVSVKYIDVLDALIQKKLLIVRQELYAGNIAPTPEHLLQKQTLNDSIVITTTIVEKSRNKLLSDITNSINKSGKRAVNFSNTLIILVLLSGIILFWYIINIINKQNYLINDLNISQQNLNEASQIKEKFLANMSHEIRTPMNSILGFTSLLQNKDMDADAKEYVSTIQKSGENLLLVVNDILDLSKIEAGMMRIESSIFNIRGLVDSIIETIKPKANEKQITLLLLVDETVPETLEGDSFRLTQILLNLVGNAIKYTNKGSVTIQIKYKKIVNNSIKIELEITDTGIGISPENISSIFGRFNQAENNTTRKYGGTGLGLSIVKELVELQKGSIAVESTINKGTSFFVTIPYTIAVEEKSVSKTIKHNTSSSTHFENARILIVEDNEFNQNLLKHIFTNWNIDFDIVNNGQEAIDILQEKKYNVILMDMQMPIMDGYTASVQIRNVLKITTPIIAMTAHALAGEREKCLSYGMNEYIAKPIREKDLYELIATFITTKTLVLGKEKNTNTNENYKYIDLHYMREISAGNLQYEQTVTKQFIQAAPVELAKLENALVKKNESTFKQIAHNMKTTISIMGLTNILQPYLDFFEYESLFNNLVNDKFIAFKKIYNSSILEAQDFLSIFSNI